MRTQISRNILVCMIILMLFANGCSPTKPAAQDGNDFEGTLAVSGAWAIYPLMVRWGEEFQELHPGVRHSFPGGARAGLRLGSGVDHHHSDHQPGHAPTGREDGKACYSLVDVPY